MNCAGCGEAMVEESFEGHYGKPPVVLDLCHACNGIWFDHRENLQLSPGGVVLLCQKMHQHRSGARNPISDVMRCPRCPEKLKSVWDMQGGTRFNYFECPAKHGRFITFFQFLREKNIVRALDPKQLNQLKQQVKFITCSNCGAPVNLEKGSACEHCKAALSAIDPKQMDATFERLHTEHVKRSTVDPNLAAKIALERAKVEQMYRQMDAKDRWSSNSTWVTWGLVEGGLDLLFDIFD